MCITQVDSKLSSFVAALSEVSSVTDPTYGPDSVGVGDTEISSLTDPTYAGVDEGAIAVSDVAVVGVGVQPRLLPPAWHVYTPRVTWSQFA